LFINPGVDIFMNVARVRNTAAGFFIILSLALGVSASPMFHSVNWLWFTLFVGANLFQSGLTNWCLMDKILAKLGVPVGAAACGVK
jgi:Protein of unknown function (DUF2892)